MYVIMDINAIFWYRAMVYILHAPSCYCDCLLYKPHDIHTPGKAAPPSKVCPICEALGKVKHHYMSKCKHLPAQDPQFMRKKQAKTCKVVVKIPCKSDTDKSSESDADENQDVPTQLIVITQRV